MQWTAQHYQENSNIRWLPWKRSQSDAEEATGKLGFSPQAGIFPIQSLKNHPSLEARLTKWSQKVAQKAMEKPHNQQHLNLGSAIPIRSYYINVLDG